MLQPKRTRFRKIQKGRTGGVKTQALHFGAYGIQCLVSVRLHAKVIEAVRRVMSRKLKRQGQIWVRVFPDIPVSQKAAHLAEQKLPFATLFVCET
jgi:large subunit ribosomal protein L16